MKQHVCFENDYLRISIQFYNDSNWQIAHRISETNHQLPILSIYTSATNVWMEPKVNLYALRDNLNRTQRQNEIKH